MTDSTLPTEQASPSALRKLVPASLLAGGIVLGAGVAPMSIAGAQTDDDTEVTEDSTAESTDSEAVERSERRGSKRLLARGTAVGALEDLGVSSEDIQAGREAGLSLTEIADAEGISQDELVDAIVASAAERAETAVEEGRLAEDEVEAKLAELAERVAERVASEPTERPERSERSEVRGRAPRAGASGDRAPQDGAVQDGAVQGGETADSGLDA